MNKSEKKNFGKAKRKKNSISYNNKKKESKYKYVPVTEQKKSNLQPT